MIGCTDRVVEVDQAQHHKSLADFFLNIIPETFVGAFAKGEILQVLFFSVLFVMPWIIVLTFSNANWMQ